MFNLCGADRETTHAVHALFPRYARAASCRLLRSMFWLATLLPVAQEAFSILYSFCVSIAVSWVAEAKRLSYISVDKT